MKRFSLLVALFFVTCSILLAQPSMRKVQLILVPDHSDALYNVNEQVKMKLIALDCGMALNNINVKIEISEDLMPVHKTETITLKGNEAVVKAGTMNKPGFLRVKAITEKDGKTYSSIATVGFEPEKLQPVTKSPEDFMEFWSKQLESARKIDPRPIITLLPNRCTDKVNVYHVSYRNIGGTRMYGMLTMPKAEGKYPAVLRLPGAGVSEKTGDISHAAQGVIILEMGIHGIPVNLQGSIYSDLATGALGAYHTYGLDSKYSYYYRRVITGCVLGVDFLTSLPQCNGKIGTMGGSQGGMLSIITSALDSRVVASGVYFPAFCDSEGYMNNRAGGWPHLLKSESNRKDDIINTIRYYDTANFARYLKAPVFYAYGYNDITCAPTTTCATYNAITAPKEVIIGENIGHWLYPEQIGALWNNLIKELKKQ